MTTALSLCSGYGGLDLAAEQTLESFTMWHAETEPAPTQVLARRWPAVPNLGDLTRADWTALDGRVELLMAGYPCQPFSGAGLRRGTTDPRHLWPHIAASIGVLRPELVLLENVRGHLSLGWDAVVVQLHALGYDVRWLLLRACDVGAPHGRARLFALARSRRDGGWTEPAGQPVAMISEAGWQSAHEGLFGAVSWQGAPPAWGAQVDGWVWATAPATEDSGAVLLPTPRTTDGNGTGTHGDGGPDLRTVVSLLPTPTSRDGKRRNQRGDDTCLTGALLPTPVAADGGGPRASSAGWGLRNVSREIALLPTPTTAPTTGNGHARNLGTEAKLLPPPRASRGASSTETTYALLPTSSAADGLGGHLSRSGDRADELLLPGVAKALGHDSSRWGVYTTAVRRWEALTRPTPPPTEPGRKGPRLSPAFSEWMMGLPAGWVTDVPGLSRNAQLRMIGNGVVPQQAAAAIRLLLADAVELKVPA